jgi:hypothetical protein
MFITFAGVEIGEGWLRDGRLSAKIPHFSQITQEMGHPAVQVQFITVRHLNVPGLFLLRQALPGANALRSGGFELKKGPHFWGHSSKEAREGKSG